MFKMRNILLLFILSFFGIIPLIALCSTFRKMRNKKKALHFGYYRFEMSLLIIMPIVMYFGLISIYNRQEDGVLISIPFLGFILTVLFIVYVEFIERSLKVKFSFFLILAWACTALTWLFFPRLSSGF